MGKKKFILGTIVVSIIALYLLFLSIDVFRLQRHNPMEGTYAVRVFIYGWHTGLVLDTGNIPAPYHKYFAMYSRKHRWLEISWGDNLFYRNRNPEKEWLLAFRAIAWPTNSVLHVMGFDMPLDHLYRQNSLITFYVSRQHYLSLIRFVSSCFISGPGSAFTIMGRGLYGDSYFLKSRGKYVFPFTCMPSIITSAIVKPLMSKMRMPYLDASYDSTYQPSRETAIKTFMYQVKRHFKKQGICVLK